MTLPSQTSVWVLGSGKAGHEANALGVANALGGVLHSVAIRPRPFFASLAPYGPIDPRDGPRHRGGALAPPFPDLAIACGRVTIPYIRRLKAVSGGRTFTVVLQDPRTGRRTADLIWVPEHDRLRGPNVLTTLTSPHGLSPSRLANARRDPDARLDSLPVPRVAMILGGPSALHRFEPSDIQGLAQIAGHLLAQGAGVMITPSRRTPPALVEALRLVCEGAGPAAFLWDGAGSNPYAAMLGRADAVVVTGDSVNMVGEAAATGVPVHVVEPTGRNPKTTQFLDRLVAMGAVRRWSGALERWDVQAIDATRLIADEIERRYAAFRAAQA